MATVGQPSFTKISCQWVLDEIFEVTPKDNLQGVIIHVGLIWVSKLLKPKEKLKMTTMCNLKLTMFFS